MKNVAIVGMGALGILFGGEIAENLKEGHAAFVMDEDRAVRHRKDSYNVRYMLQHPLPVYRCPYQ